MHNNNRKIFINNDFQIYKQGVINYYISEINKLNKKANKQNLIEKIYQRKNNAIEMLNDNYKLNKDTLEVDIIKEKRNQIEN